MGVKLVMKPSTVMVKVISMRRPEGISMVIVHGASRLVTLVVTTVMVLVSLILIAVFGRNEINIKLTLIQLLHCTTNKYTMRYSDKEYEKHKKYNNTYLKEVR